MAGGVAIDAADRSDSFFARQAMTEHKHRATPGQWAWVEGAATAPGFSCLLELRDRLAAAERRIQELEGNSRPTPNDRQIRSSAPAGGLVEQVAEALTADPFATNADDARAAILAVAEWLGEVQWNTRVVDLLPMLREEVERNG